MLDEATARDEELRRMLVATAEAAPARPSRHRAFAALLTAFVGAGALTGGAVSAAALNLPAAPSTVNVEEMATGIAYETTRLFGTPIILTGEGPMEVILGPAPEGATDIILTFNCLDAATYTLRVDTEVALTNTCDDSTGKGGGATVIPIQVNGDADHSLTVETGNNDRYAIWTSWAAPATTDPSATQRDALSDGTVTEDEYRAGFARYSQCMSDAGYPLDGVSDMGPIITYSNESAAVQSGQENRCYASEFAGLDSAWQLTDR